jgi:hypothetical protein
VRRVGWFLGTLLLCSMSVQRASALDLAPFVTDAGSKEGLSARGGSGGHTPISLDLSGAANSASHFHGSALWERSFSNPRIEQKLEAATPPILFGMLRAEPAETVIGRHRTPSFRLEGVSLFGSSISGGIDGRSAHLLLTWPTDP